MWGKRDNKKDSEEFEDSASVSAAFKNAKELGLDSSSASAAPSSRGSVSGGSLPPPPSQFRLDRHLDDSDKIVIQSARGRGGRKDETLHREGANIFLEKAASIVGPSYVFAFFGGGLYGATQVPPTKARRTTRLMLNAYVNNIGKTSSRFGNNTASLVFLYLMTGKLIDGLFYEEFEDLKLSPTLKNAVFGGVTGAIYKSTRGFRPMVFSTALGVVLGTLYSQAWQRYVLKQH